MGRFGLVLFIMIGFASTCCSHANAQDGKKLLAKKITIDKAIDKVPLKDVFEFLSNKHDLAFKLHFPKKLKE